MYIYIVVNIYIYNYIYIYTSGLHVEVAEFTNKKLASVQGTKICPVVTPTGAFFNKGVTKAMEGSLGSGEVFGSQNPLENHGKFRTKGWKR